ncbi:MAG: hypothetical protein ABL993_00985 [Vicinamibacterales bacterium]
MNKPDWLDDIVWVASTVAITVAATLMLTDNAHAGGITYETRPRQQTEDYPADSFNAWKLHLGYSAAIGTLTYAALPDLHWAAQGAICLLPGHIRENSRQHEPGNRYSERDMIVNAIGCAAGIALTHQVKVRFAPGWVGLGIKF